MSWYLGAIAAAVVVAFVVAATFAVKATRQRTEHDAVASASRVAGIASNIMDKSWALGESQAEAVAANPGLTSVLGDPAACRLTFELQPFVESRLDIVRADGRVACSSQSAAAGTIYAAGPWIAGSGAPQRRASLPPFVDPVSRAIAVGYLVPVRDSSGSVVANVVLVAPMVDVAKSLVETFFPASHFQFAISHRPTTVLLSSSFPEPIISADHIGTKRHGSAIADVLSASRPTPKAPFHVTAGVLEADALRPIRGTLLRGLAVAAAMLLVLLASLALVQRAIGRPLVVLAQHVADSGPYARERLSEMHGPREIVQLADRFRDVIDAHQSYEEQLSRLAMQDPLTGLPNRALLAERLDQALLRAERAENLVGVLFIDLDGFKVINDGLGHAAGDEVLLAISDRLASTIRPSDTLARFGGDEFVIILEGFHDEADAKDQATRVLQVVRGPLEVGGTSVSLTASIGVALARSAGGSDDLVRDADNAMYVAKERGRDRFEIFDRAIRERASSRLRLDIELRRALDRDQFELVYQPQVDLDSGRTVSVESLLRWSHPAMGSVSPAVFVPIAEETGLIVDIGRFVLAESCSQAAAWRDLGFDVGIAVNVSGRQLVESDFCDEVAAALVGTTLHPSLLSLELTESVLMTDTAQTIVKLNALRELGVKVSIDDFGTGYSSIAYLHRFPVDELKIDRAFVQGIADRPDQRVLVAAMVAMGKAFGLRIVAEGVETFSEAQEVQRLGCDTAQGFLFARPQHARDIVGHLRTMSAALQRTPGSSTIRSGR